MVPEDWVKKGSDMEILLTAALIHDIGLPIDPKKHYEAGLPKARVFLSELGFKEDEIKRILHVIEAHSRYVGPEPRTWRQRSSRMSMPLNM